jgi:glycosyltransferase involved in cell wall biosynthesis
MNHTHLPISVFITALNEADRICHAIASVRDWADEIIVIDSGSSDDTVKVARSLGAGVLFHPWQGYGQQKRFGEEQCHNDWLLNIDADEAVSPELAREIQALFADGFPKHTGYMLRACHMLPGDETVPRFTQVNTVLRLYNKRFANFSDSLVHDSVIMKQGSVGVLKGPLYHRSYRSFAHFIDKMNRYTTMQAQDMIARGQRVGVARIYVEFLVCFIKAYFFHLYIFRGARGFHYAMLYAFSRLARLAKWQELQ